MADIYSGTDDGRIDSHNTSQSPTWALSRDATTGTFVSDSENSTASFVQASRFNARGGGDPTYKVTRSFLYFNVSSITSEVAEVVLRIHGKSTNLTAGSIWGVKGDPPLIGGLDTSQFANIDGYVAGSQMGGGNCTAYTNIMTSGWNDAAYNSLTGTSDLRSDIQSNSTVVIVMTDYGYDARNIAPSSAQLVGYGAYYSDNSGTDQDPYLSIKLAGYGHDVNTVGGSNIVKINSLAVANVAKVITVE
jgi:hypothetical protein